MSYIPLVEWDVEYTDEFAEWWDTLAEAAQIDIDAIVLLLQAQGPALPFPYSSGVSGSKHPHLRELRVQHKGKPLRILYAFDPRRTAILLLGGDKTGNDRWYESAISRADRLYDEHVRTMRRKGVTEPWQSRLVP